MDAISAAGKCRSCGEALDQGVRFCHMCGADSNANDLAVALTAALHEYSALLDALAAGQITPDAFQAQALRVGTVHHGGVIFLLDAARRAWHRYDGVTMTDGACFGIEETRVPAGT